MGVKSMLPSSKVSLVEGEEEEAAAA